MCAQSYFAAHDLEKRLGEESLDVKTFDKAELAHVQLLHLARPSRNRLLFHFLMCQTEPPIAPDVLRVVLEANPAAVGTDASGEAPLFMALRARRVH